MGKIAFLAVVAVACLCGSNPKLDPLLKSVENRYNHAQTLTLDFIETYSAPRRPRQVERGTLYLRKPGRMRWDYSSPAGKVFVSDGKNVYLYMPDSRRVEKSRLKESEDMRAPLAFLLGKLNFWKEFRKFDLRPEGSGTWVSAEPNSDDLPYSRVEFLVTSGSQIRHVRVVGVDRSILDFEFEHESLNPLLSANLFSFQPPPGVEVVEDLR